MRHLRRLREEAGLSERVLANKAGISRGTLRSIENHMMQANLRHLSGIAEVFNRGVLLALIPTRPAAADLSTIAVSIAVVTDGFESWKIHFMDLVDEFRRSNDIRLLLLPPTSRLDQRLKSLLASIVFSLTEEAGLQTPEWALATHILDEPWFVSGMESFKATCLLEAPLAFRRNNIFVQQNILERA